MMIKTKSLVLLVLFPISIWGCSHVDAQDTLPLISDPIFAYSLEEAIKAPDRVVGIFLYDYDYFPIKVLSLKNIQRLGIVNCAFSSFPETVSLLQRVELIDFTKMEYIPQNISNFPNLKMIKLPNAAVLKLPTELTAMKSLAALEFRYLDSVIFPVKLHQIKEATFTITSQTVLYTSLCALPSLERIEIIGIKFSISECFMSLPYLEEIYLFNTTILDMPHDLDGLGQLRKIEIRESDISAILPDLLTHSSITSLTLIDCSIDESFVNRLHRDNLISVDTLRIEQGEFNWESYR